MMYTFFCSSRAYAATETEGSKTARKNQFCQTNGQGKLLKDDPNYADNTFCNETDVVRGCKWQLINSLKKSGDLSCVAPIE